MASSLESIFNDIEKDIEKGVRAATMATVGRITSRQGVFSGQLRASNNVGINAPDLSRIEVANYQRNAIGRTTYLAKSNAEKTVKGFNLGDSLHLSNSHDYAVYDEYKHGRLAYEGGADSFPSELKKNLAFK